MGVIEIFSEHSAKRELKAVRILKNNIHQFLFETIKFAQKSATSRMEIRVFRPTASSNRIDVGSYLYASLSAQL